VPDLRNAYIVLVRGVTRKFKPRKEAPPAPAEEVVKGFLCEIVFSHDIPIEPRREKAKGAS